MGHAIWDNNDYDVKIELSQPKLGYIKAGYTEFRSWYDGNGGFFPTQSGTCVSAAVPEMHIDRGEAWVELGLARARLAGNYYSLFTRVSRRAERFDYLGRYGS